MSYYSQVYIDLFVKTKRAEQFRSELRNLEARTEDWILCNARDLQVDEGGGLYYEDTFGKHYKTGEFAIWLKDFVEAGRILYVGESVEFWGYEFDGKARVFPLVYVEKRGDELR